MLLSSHLTVATLPQVSSKFEAKTTSEPGSTVPLKPFLNLREGQIKKCRVARAHYRHVAVVLRIPVALTAAIRPGLRTQPATQIQ